MEQRRTTQKHTSIQGVVAEQVFADSNDLISLDLDLRRVFQVKDAIDVVIHAENDFVVSESLLQQRLDGFRFEDVIRH